MQTLLHRMAISTVLSPLPMEVEIWFLIFAALVFIVILAGVKNGVERVSKVMMPLLILLAACVAVYSITRPGAVEGIKYFLIPNLENFSWMTVVAAMGQMFYSLSIAMGILYTYGSYIGKDVDIEKSTTQVEIFDTGVALLAGLMIIPAVFAFSGGDMETLPGRTGTDVHHPAESICEYGSWHDCRHRILPDVSVCGTDQCNLTS